MSATIIAPNTVLTIAKRLHRKYGCTIYFYIPESFTVDRESLTFSHITKHTDSNGRYHIPLYTFNNKIYMHTNSSRPLGEGMKVGPASANGAHYYPQED